MGKPRLETETREDRQVERQIVAGVHGGDRIVCVDSAYDVDERDRDRDRDVVVTASYCGVLCAGFVAAQVSARGGRNRSRNDRSDRC